MSFIGQSIKNKFPQWSKVRRDDSSNMSIIIDCIAEELELLRENGFALNLQQKNLLSEPLFEPGKLYKFDFKEDPDYLYQIERKTITSISLIKDSEEIPVDMNWNKYCFRYPDNFLFEKDEVIFELDLFSNYENEIVFEKEQQFFINLENVKSYVDSNFIQAWISIRGTNSLNKEIEEQIQIIDLKSYKTKNYFKTIKPLVRSNANNNRPGIKGGPGIEISGLVLDGEDSFIKITSHGFKINKDELKSRKSVVGINPFLESSYEENVNVKNNIFIEYIKEGNKSFINLLHKFLKEEKKSRVDSSKLLGSFFEESICKFELTDESGNPLETADWSIDRKRNKLVVLSKQGKIFYFSLDKPEIKRSNGIEESQDVDIVIETNSNYFLLNETVNVNVSLERPKGPISSYCILKQMPFEEDQNYYFLNSDKTWQEEPFYFKGNSFKNHFENIVPSFYFEETLTTYGQTDFYVLSFRKETKYSNQEELFKNLNKAIKRNEKGFYTNKTSVVCVKREPEKVLNTFVSEDMSEAGISIQGINNTLFVSNGSTKSYREVLIRGYFSEDNSALYLSEKFEGSTLIFKITFSDNTFYETELNYGNS